MPIMNLGDDMTAMQIQSSQDRQGSQSFVFIIRNYSPTPTEFE